MGKVPGYKMVLQFDALTLVGYRTHSIDADAEMGDATTGESTNQWKEYLPLFKGMEFSVGGLFDPVAGGKKTAYDVLDLLRQGTKFTAKWGTTEVGDTYYSVDAYIRHVHIEGPYDDLASYTVDCIATGEPSKGEVS